MTNDKSVSLRVSQQLIDRVDALRNLLAKDPEVTVYGEPTRASLLRLAILRGLDVLEQTHAPGWDLVSDEYPVADVLDAVATDPAEDPVLVEAFGSRLAAAVEMPLFDAMDVPAAEPDPATGPPADDKGEPGA